MTDYVRVLSYIYLYDDDKKIGNVGFVKMDGRNGIVKIYANIRLPFKNDLRKLRLMVYNEEDGRIISTQVGEMRLTNGVGEFRGNLKSETVVNSIGMNIRSVDEGEPLMFATYFKDTDINILKIKEEEPIYNNIDLQAESIDTAIRDEPECWERICRQYCKCRILGEEYQCIRIADKDIDSLPDKYLEFKNNSFFIQGSYYYKHILLIRRIADNTYYVGVPGCYNTNEKNTAEAFGFKGFLFSKDRKTDCTNYGYWTSKIDIF